MPDLPQRVLVLGIGNILWADEGFGVRAVETFHATWQVPAHVTVMDGGTQGLYLVHHVQEADALLVFDAIDYGLAPGTLRVVRDAEVPRFTGAKKMSLHQTGFQDVLSAAEFTGRCPSRLALVGCQPVDLENWGAPLTPPVRDAIAPALQAAGQVLAEWGVALDRRRAAPPGLLANDCDFAGYERRGTG
ncbi:Hydrogenase expression/formation protein HupD [Rhodovastum atsumiense]|uniref:Hydrogenase expression/formation protein HupD n=1 Tax=Rhodovastum atsumiense TaxID=504468 RepID=A0A5M6ILY0_9PROT|nr:HyaD/HybD family hydrogenase maturation endopeptidase [Rhodovastum atsumiense]KAA5608937.1 HyaD/HybD family hydrogenase maturation endopeptidase [Rhodovastum atsumiense]CAH2604206.1 Hydrogenase expression/formation protein HupD [Rhodovastum atsumiense]